MDEKKEHSQILSLLLIIVGVATLEVGFGMQYTEPDSKWFLLKFIGFGIIGYFAGRN